MSDAVIEPGATGIFEHPVEARHCTDRGGHRIFSTPNMVQFLENAAIAALRTVLGPDRTSVGTRVEVRHLAPTPEGMIVRAEATVREVEGSRVLFDVTLTDGIDEIGTAVHERYVLDLDRYLARLGKKVATVAEMRGAE